MTPLHERLGLLRRTAALLPRHAQEPYDSSSSPAPQYLPPEAPTQHVRRSTWFCIRGTPPALAASSHW